MFVTDMRALALRRMKNFLEKFKIDEIRNFYVKIYDLNPVPSKSRKIFKIYLRDLRTEKRDNHIH